LEHPRDLLSELKQKRALGLSFAEYDLRKDTFLLWTQRSQ